MRVVRGKVLDIVVDIRKGSPTFGQHVSTIMSGENKLQLFVPRGFAHGFVVLSPDVIFQYKCDNYYAPESEGAIAYNDPALSIDWQIDEADVQLSEKDKQNPLLKDMDWLFDFDEKLY